MAAAYRSIPAELLEDLTKRGWFERTGISGVIVMRVLSVDKETVASAVVWTSVNLRIQQLLRDRLGECHPISTREVTTLAVETLLSRSRAGS